MGNALKSLREVRGWTHEEAAQAMGVSRGGYIKLERGERRLTTETIKRAASAFGVSQSTIISAEDVTVPVVGYVGAGSAAHFFPEQQHLGEVPAPEGSTEQTVAVEIRGDSLGPLFDRWLVFYDDVRRPVTNDLIGKLCVVGLEDGRILIKKLQRSKTRGLFHLISQTEDPILDVPIEWAARVKNMVPR